MWIAINGSCLVLVNYITFLSKNVSHLFEWFRKMYHGFPHSHSLFLSSFLSHHKSLSPPLFLPFFLHLFFTIYGIVGFCSACPKYDSGSCEIFLTIPTISFLPFLVCVITFYFWPFHFCNIQVVQICTLILETLLYISCGLIFHHLDHTDIIIQVCFHCKLG